MTITFGGASIAVEVAQCITTALESSHYMFQKRALLVNGAEIKRLLLKKITADIDCTACVRESSTWRTPHVVSEDES